MKPAKPSDGALLELLEQGWRTVADRAGERLVCAPGCDHCCFGPFPVTRLDVQRLRRGLVDLRRSQPHAAAALQLRARAAREKLRGGFPGESETGRLTGDSEALDRFFEGHTALPCPALERESGNCLLYAFRPVACRTYGPPLRFGDHSAAPCRLCFRGVSPGGIEASRWEPDPGGMERALLRELGTPEDEDWFTLIAFALVAEPPLETPTA